MDMTPDDLRALAHRLRAERDRAQDIARRQRREMRGKVEARGASPARDNTGSAGKAQLLAQAAKRVNRALDRALAPPTQAAIMRALLEQKRAARRAHHPSVGRTAGQGMHAILSRQGAPGVNPGRIGSVSQQTREAQARRDG